MRVPGLFQDLWLDEIWTLGLLMSVTGPWDILMGLHHENNHFLNTLYIFAVGDGAPGWAYRALSFGSGCLALWAAGMIGLRHGTMNALASIYLCALSYPLIHYSSEARGYAPAFSMALICFYCMEEWSQRKSTGAIVFYQVAAILGLLSHPTFVYFLASAIVWAMYRECRQGRTGWESIRSAVRMNGLPVGMLIFLYVLLLRHMVSGGASQTSWPDMVLGAYSLAIGAPAHGPAAAVAVLIALAFFLSGIRLLKKQDPGLRVFYILMIVGSPLIVFLLIRPEYYFIRYLLISVPFFLLLVSRVLSHCYASGGFGKWGYVIFIILFSAGNIIHLVDFLKFGRGRYLDALEFILRRSPAETITVSGDHDFRIGAVLAYYTRQISHGGRIAYFTQADYPKEGPQWFISHHTEKDLSPPGLLRTDAYHHVYHLRKEFRSAGLSGMSWFVYEKIKPHKLNGS